MADEYISREAALADFESCNAENPNWTPQRGGGAVHGLRIFEANHQCSHRKASRDLVRSA